MKKIEMSDKEVTLYNEMKKLADRVNKRIRRLQNLTDMKEPFAVKDLGSKLRSNNLRAMTKSHRVAIQKGKTELEYKAINKAMREFLSEHSISTVKKAKKYKAKVSSELGKSVSFKQASSLFRAKTDYKWIYEYITASSYWGGVVKEAKESNWGVDKFTDTLMTVINKPLDEDLQKDIQDLYDYSLYGV